METDLLIHRRPARLARGSLGLLLVALALSYDARDREAFAQTVVTSVDIHALRGDPWPIAVSATRSGDNVLLRGTARYPNDCVAQTGFDAIYRDLAPLRSTGTRLLLLRGRRSPQGCPDIDSPVTRAFELRVPRAGEVQQLVLLDETGGQQPTIVTLAAGAVAGGGDAVQAAGMLLPLASAEVRSRTELRFHMALPPGCSPQNVAIEMVEGRSVTASREAISPIPLWVLVLTDAAACRADPATDQATEFVVSLRSLILENRQLLMVNPLWPPGAANPELFSRLAS